MKITRSLVLCAVLLMLAPCRVFADSESAVYDKACSELSQGNYEQASSDFNSLGKYEDAPQLSMYSSAIAHAEKGDYASAVDSLKQLGDFRDSELLCLYYQGCELQSEEKYEDAEAFFEKNRLQLYSDVSERIASYPELEHNRDFAAAERLLAAGQYENAYNACVKLVLKDKGNHFVSAAKPNDELFYRVGTAAEKAGDLATAYTCWRDLEQAGGYSDSGARLAAIRDEGRKALALRDVDEEKYAEARELFTELSREKQDDIDLKDKAYLLSFSTKAESMKNVADKVIAYCYEGSWGLIDLNQNTASNPYWDSIDTFVPVTDYNSGDTVQLAQVSKNGKYGYVDAHGDEHVKCQYDSVSAFDKFGLTKVSRGGKYGYLNSAKYTEGNSIVPVEYDDVSSFVEVDTADGRIGICKVCTGEGDARLYGLYSTEANPVADAVWNSIGVDDESTGIKAPAFHFDRIQVCGQNKKWQLGMLRYWSPDESQDKKWTLTGTDDKAIGNGTWDYMGRFSNNTDRNNLDSDRVPVGQNDGQDKKKCGYIDLNNELVIGGFVDSDQSLIAGSRKFVEEKKKTLVPIYEDASIFIYEKDDKGQLNGNAVAYVMLDGKYGYVDTDGNLMRAGFKFDTAEDFDGLLASVGITDEDNTEDRGFWLISADSSKTLFLSIADYRNSYQEALALQEKAENAADPNPGSYNPEKYGIYEQALAKFDSLDGFEDSFDHVRTCEEALFSYALKLRENGTGDEQCFTEPIRIFGLLADDYHYYDAKKQRLVTYYKWGLITRLAAWDECDDTKWDLARERFTGAVQFDLQAENDSSILNYIRAGDGFDAREDSISASQQVLRTWYLQGIMTRMPQYFKNSQDLRFYASADFASLSWTKLKWNKVKWSSAIDCFRAAEGYTPNYDPDDYDPADPDGEKQGAGLSPSDQVYKTWYLKGLLAERPYLEWDEARSCFMQAGNYDPDMEDVFELAKADPAGLTADGKYISAQVQINETYFQEAYAKRNGKPAWEAAPETNQEQDLVEAHRTYTWHIIGYTGAYAVNSKFVDTIIIEDTEMAAAVREAWSTISNEVKFGTYEQDGDESSSGTEPIGWIVLDFKDGDTLILSRNGLEPMAFFAKRKAATWETSIPREWLEKEFFPKAFSADEQKAIRLTQVSNSKKQNNPSYYGIKGSGDTFDRLFLLSYAEVLKYLPEEADRKAPVTSYAESKGAYSNDQGNGWWWLRSPGSRKDTASGVVADGQFDRNYVDAERNVVRPACWVDVESVIYPPSLTWPERRQSPAEIPAVRHDSEPEGEGDDIPEMNRKPAYDLDAN